MGNTDTAYSDCIVYVDESGDHSLTSIDAEYPVFVLSFCVFQKSHYSHVVTPALRMLKFATFGHDMVILHEHDIRKKIGVFNLMSKESREIFFNELNTLIAHAEFILISTVIRPGQSNRAYQILQKKFHKNSTGEVSGHGLHLYPLKSEKPQGSP